jgi:hypothetical protein
MNYQALMVGLGLGAMIAQGATVPTPDRLLPADTMAVVTVPDWKAARSGWDQHPLKAFWNDPAMTPFRTQLVESIQRALLAPLQDETGIQLRELAGLLHGQVTMGLVQNGWPARAGRPALVVLADTGDGAERMGELLDGWRKQLEEAGQPVTSEPIAGRNFFSVRVTGDAAGGVTARLGGESIQLMMGRSDTLFVMGTDRSAIEQVLSRQHEKGTAGSSLGELDVFRQDFDAGLRGSHGYGWVNLQPILSYARQLAQAQEAGGEGALALFQPTKIMAAMGIQGMRSLSFGARLAEEGSHFEFLLGLPESDRTGLVRLLVPASKPAGPPAFVPADVARFQRMRLSLPQAWSALEEVVFTVLPTARGVVDMMLFSVGKDQDPNFDLRRELFGNLGDDIIVMERAPSEQTLAAVGSPPTLILLGSPAPDRVAAALKALAGLLPPPLNELREREVAGRRFYELHLPPSDTEQGSVPMLGFVGGEGYLALSTEQDLLEEFAAGKPLAPGNRLSDLPALSESAAKVGGMANGLFGYENDRLTAQTMLEALRNESGLIEQMLQMSPLGAQLEEEGQTLRDWVDFSQLPSFDRVKQHFDFSVYGVAVRPEGVSYRVFTPKPR